MPLLDLPAPDDAALAASAALSERIRAAIRGNGGWIGFAQYMALALHEPGLGYYAGGARKFGAGGDFVTAPELGPLFGRTLARQVIELCAGRPVRLMELGAGSGALAEHLLDELAVLGHPAAAYAILETSTALRVRQRERLGDRATWLDALPARFDGVIVANEVADAIPVHAVAWTSEGPYERGVVEHEAGFAWADGPPVGGALAAAAAALDVEAPPSGRYESEIGLAARAWMSSLAASLGDGALIVVDYGFPQREYYHPQRSMGTLACHYRHRSHGDVFLHPGLQDITAHVDFTALAHAACDEGLDLLGYATQATFLANCGITDVLAAYDPADARRYAPRASEAQMLMSPAEMGELFKVLVAGRGIQGRLLGFARGDRAGTL